MVDNGSRTVIASLLVAVARIAKVQVAMAKKLDDGDKFQQEFELIEAELIDAANRLKAIVEESSQ